MEKKREICGTYFYHITIRGRNRQTIFKENDDYFTFITILNSAYKKYSFELTAFCLMRNHYHLLIRSPNVPIAKIMQVINLSYSKRFYNKYKPAESLFSQRYFSVKVPKPDAIITHSNYIHLNPTKANIVRSPEEYPYSSYRSYYFNDSLFSFVSKEPLLRYFNFSNEKYIQSCMEQGNRIKSKDLGLFK